MDLEELSKSQIILLTLLVSFVTSIATGIVTVSLMQQAPPVIAQTVNRVVEQTVEKAASAGQAAAVVTTQQPEVVNDSDLASQAITAVSPSVMRIYAGTATGSAFLGLGLVIQSSGLIAADDTTLNNGAAVAVTLPDGTAIPATVISDDTQNGIAYLSAATSTPSGAAITWSPAKLGTGVPALGQTVIAIGGMDSTRVAQGIVSVLEPLASSTEAIGTSIDSTQILQGSPLIDLTGAVIGLSTGSARAGDPSSFIEASAIHAPDSDSKENGAGAGTN